MVTQRSFMTAMLCLRTNQKFLLFAHVGTGWDVAFLCLSSLTDIDAPATLAAAALPALKLVVPFLKRITILLVQSSHLPSLNGASANRHAINSVSWRWYNINQRSVYLALVD